ncbi:MAG: ATP-binding cassette domain-containing protein [Deltaproteobacteria bacterium]|nr:ATP-binding cassette domain-containing protein [Deltaproteobacteria bacterium]MBW2015987.1 ATP-binding cassette domain-containing protein [Deltaproteobacteria bacterium]MBW2128947.1 ATP-binding cassette domain-containing protein [Deltaproteobacteria bacterium]MBW2303449.1 ATP-binding cassette domain-containing protein [Deltaproteobacteria bacterium]
MGAVDPRPLLEVRELKKYFYIKKGFKRPKILKAVDGISLRLDEGEVLGVVGESGCGKSTLGRTVLRLLPPTSGTILFEGTPILELKGRDLRRLRSRMQIIFQDPYSSLNPRLTVRRMLDQILRSHGVMDPEERRVRSLETLVRVGLQPIHLDRYPHEFSGGQRQRIAIARAMILNPDFIVADEPSSALDMSIQAQILNLMKALREEYHISYLFITHNLAAARFLCDRIAVMYLGKIVEEAGHDEFYGNPRHPYTKALLSLCPVPDPDQVARAVPLRGEVPSPIDPPGGCRFHPRCPEAMAVCREEEPRLKELTAGHLVACHKA